MGINILLLIFKYEKRKIVKKSINQEK